MLKILIIYYSNSGNTKKMAEFVSKGIQEEGEVECEVKNVEDIYIDELKEVNGIIIGSPTYYGTMTWQIKKLFDDSINLHGSLDGKVGAAFSSSGNIGGGNETTVMDILKAMLIHGMVIYGDPAGDHYGPVSIERPDSRVEKNCIRLGRRIAKLVKKLND